jgi:peptidyl-prolyl cis-trans isomerase C
MTYISAGLITMKNEYDVPEFNYHLLRNSLNKFSKNLAQLKSDEYEKVLQSAYKSFDMESMVLNTDEARSFIVSPADVEQSINSIASRYVDEDEFLQDLEANGLNRETLSAALYRELTFDGVMQIIGSKAADVTELDIMLFYEMHHDRFEQPETRMARHILITVNDDFAENTEVESRKKISEIAAKLGSRTNRFPQFSREYSECPTAMEGGKLGEVKRGQLYPELDEVLFNMAENEISEVVESEMGFHILYCEQIKPAKRIPYNKVKTRISEILLERNRRNCQKAWLAGLSGK